MHRFFCPFENTQCQGTARQDPSLTQVLSVLWRELHEQLGRRWAPAVSLRLLQQPANNRLRFHPDTNNSTESDLIRAADKVQRILK